MFIERIKENYKCNEPIFTEDLLRLFSDYSRAQIFRFIKDAKGSCEIVQFDKGIYYIPTDTIFGKSLLNIDYVIEKKYLKDNNDCVGIYSGVKLLNDFSITTQMPAVIEIVTNNESSKCREITIRGRRFILRKSRFKIDNNNVACYTILQLLSNFTKETVIDDFSRNLIVNYLNNKGVSKGNLLELSLKFPSRTTQTLIRSGLLNDIA